MGYYTNFSLSICSPVTTKISKIDSELLEKEIEKMNVFDCGDIESGWNGYSKWYEYERDMVLLSSRFPEFVFRLEGDGEDSDDKWMTYYHKGMIMYGGLEIVYHDFDADNLVKFRGMLNNTYYYEEVKR